MLSIHYKADHLKQFKVDYLVFSEYEVLYVLMLVFREVLPYGKISVNLYETQSRTNAYKYIICLVSYTEILHKIYNMYGKLYWNATGEHEAFIVPYYILSKNVNDTKAFAGFCCSSLNFQFLAYQYLFLVRLNSYMVHTHANYNTWVSRLYIGMRKLFM